MNAIDFDIPIKEGSIIQFVVDDVSYPGRIIRGCTTGKYYITSADGKCFSKSISINHCNFVDTIFDPLSKSANEYYFDILGYSNGERWPETSLEDLEKVLLQMKKDYEKQVKPSIDFSKFRFRIEDTIVYKEENHRIAGYYFSIDFNNFNGKFGYVIEGYSGGHNGSKFGYDEYGIRLPDSYDTDKYYIYEEDANSYLEKQPILNNQLKTNKNGNEIKLQRTKAVISRGTVPTGYRVRSKVNKTTISSQPLSYTKIIS